MKIVLKRTWKNKATIGILYVYNDNDLDNSIFRCFTLEDVEREVKIDHETAIPKGTYEIAFTYSPKFDRQVLMLLNVPKFDRIYLHEGTKIEDTWGCILVALRRHETTISESKPAINTLEKMAREAEARGEKIFITIS